jgi:hypothetical protein
MIRIRLTAPELSIAAHVGVMRKLFARRATLGNADGMDPWSWSEEIDGAAGELAVAKYLGMYWNGTVEDITKPDVGPYEVRTNCSRRLSDTILRPGKVHPDRVYIGVLAFPPVFEIMGWIFGDMGMQDQWLHDGGLNRPKAWFIPRSALTSMEKLPTPEDFVMLKKSITRLHPK